MSRSRERAGGLGPLLALEQFHGDEGLPIVLIDLVDGTNVLVIERGRRPRFHLETLQRLRIPGEIAGQEFQRDAASEFQVLRLVNHAHATTADLPQHAIVRNGFASQEFSRLSISRRQVSRSATSRVKYDQRLTPQIGPVMWHLIVKSCNRADFD